MKLNVLYAADGRIIALSKVSRPDDDNSGPTLRSGPEPREGQRLAVIDVADDGRALADIHRHFVVVDDGHGARLKERQART